MDVDEAFALVLREMRHERGLSQEKFSFEVGIHRTYVSQIERGLKSPSLQTIHRISSSLGISLVEIFRRVEGRMGS